MVFDKVVKIYIDRWKSVLEKEHASFLSHYVLEKIISSEFESRRLMFPEGQKVALVNNIPYGSINSLIVPSDDPPNDIEEKWNGVTSDGHFLKHKYPKDNGNVLLCVAIYTDKNSEAKVKGAARQLIFAQRDIAIEMELDKLYAYSRFLRYLEYINKNGQIHPEEYIHKKEIINGEERYFDGSTGFHLSLGAKLARILPDSRPADKNSCGYCVMMEYVLPKRAV